jgi:hypothetical protein
VVVLRFGWLHDGAQQPESPVHGSLFQAGVPALPVFAEQSRGPLRRVEGFRFCGTESG